MSTGSGQLHVSETILSFAGICKNCVFPPTTGPLTEHKEDKMIDYWIAAWEKIETIYNNGEICSERHFQSELLHILYSDPTFKTKYLLHVEPNLFYDDKANRDTVFKGIIPDILVTEGEKIVAYAELKYVPHGYIPYIKDIRNFLKLYKYRRENLQIPLFTDPINGNWNFQRKFTFDKDMILIYAVITNHESDFITHGEKIWSSDEQELPKVPKYLFLKGTTDFKTAPKFWTETNIL